MSSAIRPAPFVVGMCLQTVMERRLAANSLGKRSELGAKARRI
jgi:hypothetical protein